MLRLARKRGWGSTRTVWVPVALTITLTAGCTSEGTGTPPSLGPGSIPSTPTVDPSAAATTAAVAAYQGYIKAFAAALQTADPDDPNLARYVADPLLSRTRRVLRSMREEGQVQVGEQTATVTTTDVDLASDQPVVTIHACLDYSNLKLVYRSNRSPVPNATIKDPKVSAIATVWLYRNGQWLVNDTKDGGDAC